MTFNQFSNSYWTFLWRVHRGKGEDGETTHSALQMNDEHIGNGNGSFYWTQRHWKAMRANRGDLTCSQLAVPASWLHALFCPSYSHPPLSTRQDHHLGFLLVLDHFIWVIYIKWFVLFIFLSESNTHLDHKTNYKSWPDFPSFCRVLDLLQCWV